jgi:ATP-dependent helicase/nuclease subunit A
MTRAAERLVIAGFHGPRGKAKDCWYDMARAGLESALTSQPAPWSAEEKVWRLGEGWRAAGGTRDPAPKAGRLAPSWLLARAAPERALAPLNPSRANPSIAYSGAKRKSRLEAGRLSHSLLQYLPEISPDRQREASRSRITARSWSASSASSAIRASTPFLASSRALRSPLPSILSDRDGRRRRSSAASTASPSAKKA